MKKDEARAPLAVPTAARRTRASRRRDTYTSRAVRGELLGGPGAFSRGAAVVPARWRCRRPALLFSPRLDLLVACLPPAPSVAPRRTARSLVELAIPRKSRRTLSQDAHAREYKQDARRQCINLSRRSWGVDGLRGELMESHFANLFTPDESRAKIRPREDPVENLTLESVWLAQLSQSILSKVC